MPVRKLAALALLAGLLTACSDITGPQTSQQNGVCAVTGGGQTCVE